MNWLPSLIEWLDRTGPGAPPVPELDGAPAGLRGALEALAERLGPAGPALVDDARLTELASLGDPELVRHVAETFFGAVPAQLASIRSAVAAADAPGVRGVAHTIKGGAASAGFPAVSELAAELEDAARASDTSRFDELVAALSAAVARTEAVVTSRLDESL